MKKIFFHLFIISYSFEALAAVPQAGWGVKIKDESSELKIGGRLQGIAKLDSSDQDQNLYLRRVRVNLQYRPWEGHKFSFDVRNDDSNKRGKGDGEFQIGDAYWELKSHSKFINNFRFFRAKVDVSYTQTSSSKNLFAPDRALPAEVAADFIVSGRRATNAQINGNIGALAYQLALSEGLSKEDIDAISSSDNVSNVLSQSLVIGGKLRYYFFGSAQKDIVQDTFYGKYNAFSVGLGHFSLDRIELELDSSDEVTLSRKLTNIELAYSNGPFRFLGEAFYFEGLTIDYGENKDAHGEGGYAQAEWNFGKFAPYLGHEIMNYDTNDSGLKNVGNYIGLNYYENLEAMRFGLQAKENDRGELIGDDKEFVFKAYAMLNF